MRKKNRICSIHPEYLCNIPVCKHFDNQTASNLIILKNNQIVCQKCFNKIDKLIENEDIKYLCSKCVSEILNIYIEKIEKMGYNINEYIIGLENFNKNKGYLNE